MKLFGVLDCLCFLWLNWHGAGLAVFIRAQSAFDVKLKAEICTVFTPCLAHLKGCHWKSLPAFDTAKNNFVPVINGIFSFESLGIFLAEVVRCWASFKFQRKGILISICNYSPQNLGLGFCLLWSLALLKEQRGREIDWRQYAVMLLMACLYWRQNVCRYWITLTPTISTTYNNPIIHWVSF